MGDAASASGLETPIEPAKDDAVLLAFIVVLPEFVSLIVLLVTTDRWRPQDLRVLFFVFIAGLTTTADMFTLAVWESVGANRADGTPDKPATLIYRPRLLWTAAAVLAACYVVIPLIVVGVMRALRHRRLTAPDNADHNGGMAADGGNIASRRRPAWKRRWRFRRRRIGSCIGHPRRSVASAADVSAASGEAAGNVAATAVAVTLSELSPCELQAGGDPPMAPADGAQVEDSPV